MCCRDSRTNEWKIEKAEGEGPCQACCSYWQWRQALTLKKYPWVRRMANGTPEERGMRLQQMWDKLAAENPEEWERRLCRWAPPSVKGGQFKPKERELQLECYSTENNSLWTHSLHCFNSVPIRPIKPTKIHANMATLDMPTRSNCSETFPGLRFHPKSNECLPWQACSKIILLCKQH